MEEIVNLITNNGIGVCCVAYLIYFQNTTMKEMLKSLTDISTKLALIEEKIKPKVKNNESGEK